MTANDKARKLIMQFYPHAKESEILGAEKQVSDGVKFYCAKQCAITHLELVKQHMRDKEVDDKIDEIEIDRLIFEINRMRK